MKNIEILGSLGEKLVRNIFMQQGCVVLDSMDPYDRKKDFTRDGKTVEVKTEQPYVLKDCFSFRADQFEKCRNVDELYFVSVPPVARPDYEHGGKVFATVPSKFEYFNYKTKSGIDMVGVPIEQDDMHCIYNMSDDELQQFTRYTSSQYRRI